MRALTERHVQAIWYDAQLRPPRLVTRRGLAVRVISPGEWNLGPGPDFRHAVLEVGPERRRLIGDVEVHICPADYDFHRHGADPAYRNVIAHVTWRGGPDPRTLPEGAVSIWIGRLMTANTEFSLDQVDLMAYPYARLPLAERPCAEVFRNPEQAQRLLAAAGRYRLKLKARRLAGRMVEAMQRLPPTPMIVEPARRQAMDWVHSPSLSRSSGSPIDSRERLIRQIFYEEVMTALGYSRNSRQFRRIAERVPIDELPPDADFLRTALLAAATFEIWERAAVRPGNSPAQRLASAAEIMITTPMLELSQTSEFTPANCRWMIEAMGRPQSAVLGGSQPQSPGRRLLGKGRAAAILANVVVPWAIANERLATAPDWLPPEDISEPVRLTAYRLFGRDHNPKAHYANNGLLIQGLLQIHRDYCLQMHPDCDECGLGRLPSNTIDRPRSPLTASDRPRLSLTNFNHN